MDDGKYLTKKYVEDIWSKDTDTGIYGKQWEFDDKYIRAADKWFKEGGFHKKKKKELTPEERYDRAMKGI